ncbi:serine hydrolase domain-containing protein [Nannocystis sp.]|uniref:serine hydrolase domain-containing protein n=1 Tax=Nannocystis sp. TaxID=1962667 RepID=UPI0025F27BB4|nr:serine hydrolase domain-containing protein [Nannocystis sp.]MBK7830403.1 beta-lactamase family protein [Nannocystis sp.]
MTSRDPQQGLFTLLEAAVAAGTFPGCVALVWRDGALLYHEAHGHFATHPDGPERFRGVTREAVYDLASLTKVLCTTTLAAIAVSERRVGLDDLVPAPWSAACPGATLGQLLTHSGGLAAHREYFAELGRRGPGERVLGLVCATPPVHAAGTHTIYSDLGLMIVGAWLERLFDAPLDRVFADRVAWPLGLDAGVVPRLGFHRLQGARGAAPAEQGLVVPTEVYDPSLHPHGVPSWFACRAPLRAAHYEVHDDNAFVMNGVAGHAGLFGDAGAVLELGRAWLQGGLPGLDDRSRLGFLEHRSPVPGSTRRLGWDSPSPDGSGSTGVALSQEASGHLGYTGTSLWIDPHPPDGRGPVIVVLLSNRVHPTRDNPAIVQLRPSFHRAAVLL